MHPAESGDFWLLARYRLGYLRRDAANVLRHGRNAPRIGQRIWVDPMECDYALDQSHPIGRRSSGLAIGGDWDLAVQPVETIQKVRYCLKHWRDGVPWDQTGAYEHVLNIIAERGRSFDGCLTKDDVVRRYERLDRIFEQASRERRLRTLDELPGRSLRELGGILIHIGRDCQPLFDRGGTHRFAIARILRLDRFPAQIGAVHTSALSTWKAKYTRQPRPS